jgi:hypothetical protein
VTNAADMTAFVTRGELKEEFALFEQKLDVRFAQLATRADLEVWGGALDDRWANRIDQVEQRLHADLGKRIDQAEQRLHADLGKRIDQAEQRLHDDLAMLAKSHQESMATLISIIDEKYADLPARVKRLEAASSTPGGAERAVRRGRRGRP